MATMTLNLRDDENRALEEMAKESDLSKTALIRQALRLRQYIKAREQNGYEMVFRHIATGTVTTFLLELPKMSPTSKGPADGK